MIYQIILWLLPLLLGLNLILNSVYDRDRFFNYRKARFVVFLMGRNGARIFYTAMGVVVIVLGYGLLIMDRFG